MLNRSASLAMPINVLKASPGKLDIKRQEPGIVFIWCKKFISQQNNDDLILNLIIVLCITTEHNR